LRGGQVQVMFDNIWTSIKHIKPNDSVRSELSYVGDLSEPTMRDPIIPTAVLLAALLGGGPAVAQDATKPRGTESIGKSLAEPYHQQEADDAMHTESGKTGKDEPSSHAPLDGRAPPLKDGKLNPTNAPTAGEPSSGR
jgi:hypothetical protein